MQLGPFMDWVETRNPHEPEFVQAVREMAETLTSFINDNSVYLEHRVLERLTEPDRVIAFRVVWEDDEGNVRINRGWRVQHCNAIGPYKGGLRFHPTTSLSVLKFLGFEQTFKNALTGLPMGGGKGGSDFDPSGCSDREIMRFCQAFMAELHRHIGPRTDIPAGDINVGEREIGFMFGAYKRITGTFDGVLTGKGLDYGGSPMRPEATGFGLGYFVCRMMAEHDRSMDKRKVAISGAGNVALHAAKKVMELGAKVVTLSNSKGTAEFADGLSDSLIEDLLNKEVTLDSLPKSAGARWHGGKKPWAVECDVALPCATQNELDEKDAQALVKSGVVAVGEGANMPCTREAIAIFQKNDVLFGPAKAANAGGVALSGLEMSQNAAFETRDREQLGEKLNSIMCTIHDRCLEHGKRKTRSVDYVSGANIAAFRKVADALVAFGTT